MPDDSDTPPSSREIVGRSRLQAAEEHIQRHFNDNAKLKLKMIAQQAQLSEFEFPRQFRKAFRLTVKNRIDQLRIAEATRFLGAGVPLKEIPKACGWSHHAHFSSRFKKLTGMTPTQWQRQQGPTALTLAGFVER